VAVTVGAAALLAGCGAGGGDPQAATPQGVDLSEVGEPTAPADPMALRWQYVAEANAMCEETTRVALSQLQIPEDPVAAVELMDSALLGSRAMVERLRAIPPPPGDEAVVADMVAKQDVLLDRMEELVGQVTIFDPSPVVDARPELAALEVDADAALLDYGLSSCT
jgi:hypothetical protein